MSNRRLIWLDSLKGILILFVILGHAIQCLYGDGCHNNHIWNIIYSFHMPAFMAVSGWFAYRHQQNINIWGVVKRRTIQLLVPYFIWSLLTFVLLGDYTIERLEKMIFYPDAYFWFLWVLFWINVSFVSVQFVSQKCGVAEIIPIILLCVIFMGMMVGLNIRVFGFQFIAYYFIFYTFGYCMHKYDLLKIRNRYCLAGLVIIWSILAWYWKMHDLPDWVPTIPHVPVSVIQYAYRGVTAIIAILVLLSFASNSLNGSNKLNTYIAHLGIFSLGLYVIHLEMMGHIVKGLRFAIPNVSNSMLVVFTFVSSLIVSVIIIELIRCSKIATKLLLGKYTQK